MFVDILIGVYTLKEKITERLIQHMYDMPIMWWEYSYHIKEGKKSVEWMLKNWYI